MKFHRLLSLFVFTIWTILLTAQANNTDHQIKCQLLQPTNTLVDNQLSSYQLVETDYFRASRRIKTNDQLTLTIGAEQYNLQVFSDNILVNPEILGDRQVLGGTTESGEQISLTIAEDFIFGFITKNGVRHYIQPLYYFDKNAQSNQFVFFKENEVKEEHKHAVCGHSIKENIVNENLSSKVQTTGCKIMKIAIANANDMLVKYGNENAILNHNLAILNLTQTDYRSEFETNIEFEMTAFYVAQSTSQEPFAENANSSDATELLPSFRNWASDGSGGLPGGTLGGFGEAFDIAAVWTARDILQGSGSIIGLAYNPGWFQILEDYTPTATRLQTLMTHETGHNLGANHDAAGMNTIMAPSSGHNVSWSPVSFNAISTYLGQLNYLPNCSTAGAPVAVAFQSSLVICQGSSVVFEDQSRYGHTRTWSFENGNIPTSTDSKPEVRYDDMGVHLITLNSSNAAGQDSYTTLINVQQEPPVGCTPDESRGSGGITQVSFNNLIHDSDLSETAGNYENNICVGTANLTPGVPNDLRITLSGVTYINFYFDFNSDGDFTDTNESDTGYFINQDGTYTVPLNMPSSPVMNTLLRMRIVTSGESISGPCDNPEIGQVEDYGIYFFAAQVLGCTDPEANNYNPQATVDDGSCAYGTAITYYEDMDSDGFGNAAVSIMASTTPTGYVTNNTDCNDNNASMYPGAPELCDGLDNDCDGQEDNGLAQSTYFIDTDNDGFGDISVSIVACEEPIGYVANGDDCNDSNAAINPLVDEICDGIDNNCDGMIDETGEQTYYIDEDNDGYGNANITITGCEQPLGYVTLEGDCNDNDPTINPTAPELCDGLDNNCNSSTDEGIDSTTYYEDKDEDGFGNSNSTIIDCRRPEGYASIGGDCDDNNAAINPEAAELCDGLDNNCNSITDEGVSDTTYYEDKDDDGFGDSDSSVTGCEQPEGYVAISGDCDDNDATVNPDAPELCDGLDNNCNSITDEGVSDTTYYEDKDDDGFGDSDSTVTECEQPEGYVAIGGDCDDNDATVNPDAPELCDGLDNNCNSITDEGVSDTTYYEDQDADGFGDSNSTVTECEQPDGYVTIGGDCDDNDAAINPDAPELCDGMDNNCNGSMDEGLYFEIYYEDQDNDGYGNEDNSMMSCDRPEGYALEPGDCDDNNPLIHPGQIELCDGIDNNCSGTVDDEDCNDFGSRLWEDSNGNEIYDASTEKGKEGILIRLNRNAKVDIIAETYTDETGAFGFSEIPDGEYELHISLDSLTDMIVHYDANEYRVEENFLISNTFTMDGNPVSISPVNFYQGAVLSGKFYYQSNLAAANSVVYLFRDEDTIELIDSIQTGAEGAYSFEMLPKGNYYLEFRAPTGDDFVMNSNESSVSNTYFNNSFQTEFGQTASFELGPGDNITDVNAILSSSGTLGLGSELTLKGYWDEQQSASILSWENIEGTLYDKVELQRSLSADYNFKSILTQQDFSEYTYSYSDQLRADNIYYYRVKAQTTAGTALESNTISISAEGSSKFAELFPNPSSGMVYLDLRETAESLDITVIDKTGRVVLEPVAKRESNQLIGVDLSSLAEGLYYIKLSTPDYSQTSKITIAK